MTTTKHRTFGLSAAMMVTLAAACSSGDDGDGGDGAGAGSGAGGSGGSSAAGTSGSAGGSGSSAGSGAAGSDAAGSGAPAPVGPFYGPFEIKLIAETAVGVHGDMRPARTEVTGFIRDGIEPEKRGWELTDEIGDCGLYEPDMPTCDPRCNTATEVCAPGDVCLPIPAKRSAGLTTIEGLGDAPFELEDKVAGNYTLPTGFSLPYPPCAEGEPITFTVRGDASGPFVMEVPCVATTTAPEPVSVDRGSPIALRWAVPEMPDLATMHVHLDIAHHGGVRGQIECATADDGELDIDAALTDGLLDLGVAGFPTVVLSRSRSTQGTGASAENLSLTISSSYESPVMIDGLVSCVDTAMCPAGQTCGTDLRCQ